MSLISSETPRPPVIARRKLLRIGHLAERVQLLLHGHDNARFHHFVKAKIEKLASLRFAQYFSP